MAGHKMAFAQFPRDGGFFPAVGDCPGTAGMEAAARRHIYGVRGFPLEQNPLFDAAPGGGDDRYQGLGIGMQGGLDNIIGIAQLHDFSQVEDGDAGGNKRG